MAAIDTHRIVKRLMQAGFSDAQAETVTDVVRETHEQSVSDLATKADIVALRVELKAEIAALRAEFRADIAELRAEVKADIAELRAEVKADITELRAEVKAGITELRAQFKAELAALRTEMKADKADLLKWVIGMFLVQIGVIVTLLKVMLGGH